MLDRPGDGRSRLGTYSLAVAGTEQERWRWAALRILPVRGVLVGVQLLSSRHGGCVVEAVELATGRLVGADEVADEFWVTEPDYRMCVVPAGDGGYVVVLGKWLRCHIWRLTAGGLRYLDSVGEPPADTVHELAAAAALDGSPALLTSDWHQVRFRRLPDGTQLRPQWTVPPGWKVDRLVVAGGRPYAWLETDQAAGTDPPRRLNWLWDLADQVPVRRPVAVHGPRSGPHPLGNRPAMLIQAGWPPAHQLWDLALGRPVGQHLAGTPPSQEALSIGMLHGRPVLAAAGPDGLAMMVWDAGTGELVYTAMLPRPPIASQPGPGGHLYVTGDDGVVTDLPVPLAAVHPVARRRLPCPCGHHRYTVPRTVADALALASRWDPIDPLLDRVAVDDSRWLAVYRCRSCGRHWAEDCISSGQADLFYGYPIDTTDPTAWLAATTPLRLRR